MNCKICYREAIKDELCSVHLEAYENLSDKYGDWKKALKLPWREYLSEIRRNSLTGEWTKEVVSHLITSEETANVEES